MNKKLAALAVLVAALTITTIAFAGAITGSSPNSLSATFSNLKPCTSYTLSVSPADDAPVTAQTDCPSLPSADFTYSPSAPVVGQTVSFSCATDTGVSCRWDRTNDQVPEASLPPDQTFNYAYTSSGTKTTCVQAVDQYGQVSPWVCHQLTVADATPPPPPPPSLLFNGDFETGNLSQWQHVIDPSTSGPPPQAVASPHIQGSYAAQLTVAPADSEGAPANSSRVDLYENANTAWASDGKDVWEHGYVMLPSAANATYPYRPTPGGWNWLFQWHSTSNIIGGISVTGGEPVEMGVQTGVSFTDSGCGYSSGGDVTKQELFGYFTGGNISGGPVAQHKWCLNAPLQYDHWYDVYYHIIWSKSASVGLFHLEIDGNVVADLHQATLLYNSSSGATDIPNIEVSNYRVQDSSITWNSTVYYDGVQLGPTKASVG